MLALPATTPTKTVEILDFRTTINQFKHLPRADIYTFAATGALIFVNVKFRFILLHTLLAFNCNAGVSIPTAKVVNV
jgi:hypothetical protein